jgi:ribosomal protein S18 acetylase RimI-like enzyme
MDTYQLVAAHLGDLFALRHLEHLCFSPPDRYDWFTLFTLLTMPGIVNLKSVTTTGQVIGHVAGDSHPARDFAWIVTLAVHPDHRRRGVAQQLLAACEARLPVSLIRLTVRESNAAAIALYEKQGYKPVHIRQRYYIDGEDGVIMEKRTRLR